MRIISADNNNGSRATLHGNTLTIDTHRAELEEIASAPDTHPTTANDIYLLLNTSFYGC